jgi:hypothetical protein
MVASSESICRSSVGEHLSDIVVHHVRPKLHQSSQASSKVAKGCLGMIRLLVILFSRIGSFRSRTDVSVA